MSTLSFLYRDEEHMGILSLSCVSSIIKDIVISGDNYLGIAQGVSSKEYARTLRSQVRKRDTINGLRFHDKQQVGVMFDYKIETFTGEDLTDYVSHKEDEHLLFFGNCCKRPTIMDEAYEIFQQTTGSVSDRLISMITELKEVGLDNRCKDLSSTSLYYGIYDHYGTTQSSITILNKVKDPIDELLKSL